MKTGIELIAAERERQMQVEGWTPDHDDGHKNGELSKAALCYASLAEDQVDRKHNDGEQMPPPEFWPWQDWGGDNWWKPSNDPVRNLVKAGALIAAEIDRLQRKALAEPLINAT